MKQIVVLFLNVYHSTYGVISELPTDGLGEDLRKTLPRLEILNIGRNADFIKESL